MQKLFLNLKENYCCLWESFTNHDHFVLSNFSYCVTAHSLPKKVKFSLVIMNHKCLNFLAGSGFFRLFLLGKTIFKISLDLSILSTRTRKHFGTKNKNTSYTNIVRHRRTGRDTDLQIYSTFLSASTKIPCS